MALYRKAIPNISALQAFECAARHQSFTQAAKELNLTQSAVSRQIKELENQLGVALFERVRQRVVVSNSGQKFLIDARRILTQTEDAMLRTMTASWSENSLSIASLPTFGGRWLAPRLPDFLMQHPSTSLSITSRLKPFDFQEEPFDLAIHFGQPVWARAECHHLCDEIMVPVAGKKLLEETAIKNLKDLNNAMLLHIATRPKAWEYWFNTYGLERENIHHGHRFDQYSTIIEAVKAGLGVALMPLFLIQKELTEGNVTVLFNKSVKYDNSYYAVIPEDKVNIPVIKHFLLWITGEMGKTAPEIENILNT